MIELNWTLILQMINFLILLLILNKLLFKPILNIIAQRKKQIQDSEYAVKDMDNRAKEKLTAYEKLIIDAKLQAIAEKEKIKSEGIEMDRKILDEVRLESEKLLTEAIQGIESETARAREIIRGQAEEISFEIAEKVLGRSLK